ncbi:MAG: serine/threonine-protein kinase [Deltaproteobacteria bacterium]|nr:serine/threonine-protein kinase [Deltaproteobacteria bacterium]
MNPTDIEQQRKANWILLDCLDRPVEARTAFLDKACGDDEALRQLVESLLGFEESELRGVEMPVLRLLPDCASDLPQSGSAAAMVGLEIGPYRVIEELGRGGTGAVYLAERVDGAFERQVAIKVLKRGMDTDEIVARFSTERQILAQLAHPNIAQLLEGGALEDGRPYFVMPYIEGERIDRHCARENLGVRARVELFLKVCEAVAHAHRNLVVHRDLKPSNILVGVDREPRLLDFGIAKLLDPLTRRPITGTVPGLLLLTPAYASPEQWAGRAVTPATDVYSLGVVLFEILAGARPEVPRESATGAEQRVSQAARDPNRAREIRGDLDSVVAKAMAVDPDHRYSSVEALAEDLRRYLEGHPVKALADLWFFRLRKWTWRRRREVGISLLGCAVIIALATDRQLETRRAAEERVRAAEVSEFLLELYRLEEDGSPLEVRKLLDRGVQHVALGSARQKDLQAELMDVLGMGYARLGFYEEAEPMLEGALTLRQKLFGDRHSKVAESLLAMAQLHQNQGRYKAGEAAVREAIEIGRQIYEETDARQFSMRNHLGLLLLKKGDFLAAEQQLRQALEGYRALDVREPRAEAAIESNLGIVLIKLADYGEAAEVLGEALETSSAVLGRDHPQTSAARSNLGAALSAHGAYAQAEVLGRQVLTLTERRHGPEHPAVAHSLNSLALLLQKRGQAREAEVMLRRAEEILGSRLGDEHLLVLRTRALHAGTLADLGHIQEGLAKSEAAFRAVSKGTEAEHPDALIIGSVVARLRLAADDLEGAEELARQMVEGQREVVGPHHPDTGRGLHLCAQVHFRRAELHLRRADAVAAERLARSAREVLSHRLPPLHPDLVRAGGTLGGALLLQKRYAEAEPLLRAAANMEREVRGTESRAGRAAQARLDAVHRQWRP